MFGPMKTIHLLAVIAGNLAFAAPDITAAAAYEEPYWETKNPARVFDWDTLKLLLSTKIEKVKIDADSPEKLISQLEKAVHGIKGAQEIRFGFKRELWEQPHTDGTIGKITVNVRLELENTDLLDLLRYVSEINGMAFSVKKGEIVFRPLIG